MKEYRTPTSAQTAHSGGSSDDIAGSAETLHDIPDGLIPIYGIADLRKIGSSVPQRGHDGVTYQWGLGDRYVLMDDLHFDALADGDFMPIGKTGSPFTGTFDGSGHTITGMRIRIRSDSAVQAGMFAAVSGAEIYDLNIADAEVYAEVRTSENVIANIYAGILIASATGDVCVERCSVSGNVTAVRSNSSKAASQTYIGGIIGRAGPTSVNISNCAFSGNIRSDMPSYANHSNYAYCGGIIGCSVSIRSISVSGCAADGSIVTKVTSSDHYYALMCTGGIAGYVDGDSCIRDCDNRMSISSEIDTAGNADASSAEVITGGIIGSAAHAEIVKCGNLGHICSFAAMKGADADVKVYAGGIAGSAESCKVIKCGNKGNVHAAAVSSACKERQASVCAGGVVGACESSYGVSAIRSECSLSYCYNSAKVTAGTRTTCHSLVDIGGTAGRTEGSFRMSSCFNTGRLDASIESSDAPEALRAGGLIGSTGYGDTYLAHSYNAGEITANSRDASMCAFVGHALCGIESKYLISADTIAFRMFPRPVTGAVKDTGSSMLKRAEMKNEEAYKWPSFGKIWTMSKDINSGFPYFAGSLSELCMISFDTYGGGPIPPITQNTGAAIELPIPNKDGTEFKGWYTGPNGTGEKILSPVCVTNDMNLHAHWSDDDQEPPSGGQDVVTPFLALALGITAAGIVSAQAQTHRGSGRQ